MQHILSRGWTSLIITLPAFVELIFQCVYVGGAWGARNEQGNLQHDKQ